MVNFPFISIIIAIFKHHQRIEFTFSNSYVIQELVYSTVQCSHFLNRAQLLTQKLLKQGYVLLRLKSSLQKVYGRLHNLVDRYEISISQMTMDLLLFTQIFPFLYHGQDFLPDLTVYISNTAGVLSEAGTAYPSRASEFTPGFLVGSVLLILFRFFVLSEYVSLRSEFRVVMAVTISAQKRFSVRLYLQLFVGGGGSCLIDVICVCLRIVVSNTYCVVFLFCFSSSCVPYVASLSGLSIFDCPFGFL